MHSGDLWMPLDRTLRNGVRMPIMGLGVWKIEQGPDCEQAVTWALEAGYRHIDTAKLYVNEESVGKAVARSGIPRGDIFLTTKLLPTDIFNVRRTCESSLRKLGVEYVDLYLLHWPVPFLNRRLWRAMEKLVDDGLARAIGVCNFSVPELEDLRSSASTLPSVNQVEFNPFRWDKGLLEYCEQNGIVLEAYASLTQGNRLSDAVITKIAQKYRKMPAQILLRWAVQKNVPVIPKSSQRKHIVDNADIFDFTLEAGDMGELDAIQDRPRE